VALDTGKIIELAVEIKKIAYEASSRLKLMEIILLTLAGLDWDHCIWCFLQNTYHKLQDFLTLITGVFRQLILLALS